MELMEQLGDNFCDFLINYKVIKIYEFVKRYYVIIGDGLLKKCEVIIDSDFVKKYYVIVDHGLLKKFEVRNFI